MTGRGGNRATRGEAILTADLSFSKHSPTNNNWTIGAAPPPLGCTGPLAASGPRAPRALLDGREPTAGGRRSLPPTRGRAGAAGPSPRHCRRARRGVRLPEVIERGARLRPRPSCEPWRLDKEVWKRGRMRRHSPRVQSPHARLMSGPPALLSVSAAPSPWPLTPPRAHDRSDRHPSAASCFPATGARGRSRVDRGGRRLSPAPPLPDPPHPSNRPGAPPVPAFWRPQAYPVPSRRGRPRIGLEPEPLLPLLALEFFDPHPTPPVPLPSPPPPPREHPSTLRFPSSPDLGGRGAPKDVHSGLPRPLLLSTRRSRGDRGSRSGARYRSPRPTGGPFTHTLSTPDL